MPETPTINSRFNRGSGNSVKSLRETNSNSAKEARLRNEFKRTERPYQQAAENAQIHAEHSSLQQGGAIELEQNEDFKLISQRDILADADMMTANKRFGLHSLPGKYRLRYSPTGKQLLLGSTRGHFATLDWQSKKLVQEFDVREQVNAITWLHQEQFFAAALSKWTRVYETETGSEIHCINHFHKMKHLSFLPYHFLLVGAAERYKLHYLDISTGKKVSTVNTETPARINSMCQNKQNAVIHLGMQDGTVGLYTPNQEKGCVVKVLAMREPVQSIAVDHSGQYLATAGQSKRVNVYDLRNSYKPVCEHFLFGGSQNLSWSGSGLLAATYSNGWVNTYQGAHLAPIQKPYIGYHVPDTIQDIDFCPMEDVLGIGYNTGFESILIPGAAKTSIDSYENNPFRTKKQKDHWEISRLLDKIPPKMIAIDNTELRRVKAAKTLDQDVKEASDDESLKKEADSVSSSEPEEEEAVQLDPINLKKKMKGKSRTGHKELRKKQIRSEKVREHKQQLLEKKLKRKQKKLILDDGETGSKQKKSALDRFR